MSVPPGLDYGLFLECFFGHCIIKPLPEFYDGIFFKSAGFGNDKLSNGFDHGYFDIFVICRSSVHNDHLLSLEYPAEQTLYPTTKTEELQTIKNLEKNPIQGLISAENGNTVKALGVITHDTSGSRSVNSAAEKAYIKSLYTRR